MQKLMTHGELLGDDGALIESGYATSLVREYRRSAIKASTLRIKEWDYYLIYNGSFGVALTIADNAYMSMLSVSVIDFNAPNETTASVMGAFPMGRVHLPETSKEGISKLRIGKSEFAYFVGNGKRRLICHMDKFADRKPFDCDITLSNEPQDSMVIATPFKNKPTSFYYNQKIVGMRAEGIIRFSGRSLKFKPDDSFGLLDWGRGVWTYDNTWYWGAAHGIVDGRVIGFNIGCGFGDTSNATENMLFADGYAHKIDDVAFNIPKTADGNDNYMSPWTFTSSDNRFEMRFEPIIDRKAIINALVIESRQHQVFGRFSGRMRLNNGIEIEIRDFLGFAEKVRNRW